MLIFLQLCLIILLRIIIILKTKKYNYFYYNIKKNLINLFGFLIIVVVSLIKKHNQLFLASLF